MENLPAVPDSLHDAIDVEVLRNYLPGGSFVVSVNQDEFDDDIFECYVEDDHKDGWSEFMLVEDSPEGAYCVQGQVLFAKQDGDRLIVRETRDTAVKLAEVVRYHPSYQDRLLCEEDSTEEVALLSSLHRR